MKTFPTKREDFVSMLTQTAWYQVLHDSQRMLDIIIIIIMVIFKCYFSADLIALS